MAAIALQKIVALELCAWNLGTLEAFVGRMAPLSFVGQGIALQICWSVIRNLFFVAQFIFVPSFFEQRHFPVRFSSWRLFVKCMNRLKSLHHHGVIYIGVKSTLACVCPCVFACVRSGL
jgi:hypothetical protein